MSPEWQRQVLASLLTAGAVYGGIRADLATLNADVRHLSQNSQQQAAQLEKLREVRR